VAGDDRVDDGVAGPAVTVAGQELGQGDAEFEADRLPGPLRQAAGAGDFGNSPVSIAEITQLVECSASRCRG
jgi:hypothetical protein